jgi:hypothetical protein
VLSDQDLEREIRSMRQRLLFVSDQILIELSGLVRRIEEVPPQRRASLRAASLEIISIQNRLRAEADSLQGPVSTRAEIMRSLLQAQLAAREHLAILVREQSPEPTLALPQPFPPPARPSFPRPSRPDYWHRASELLAAQSAARHAATSRLPIPSAEPRPLREIRPTARRAVVRRRAPAPAREASSPPIALIGIVACTIIILGGLVLRSGVLIPRDGRPQDATEVAEGRPPKIDGRIGDVTAASAVRPPPAQPQIEAEPPAAPVAPAPQPPPVAVLPTEPAIELPAVPAAPAATVPHDGAAARRPEPPQAAAPPKALPPAAPAKASPPPPAAPSPPAVVAALPPPQPVAPALQAPPRAPAAEEAGNERFVPVVFTHEDHTTAMQAFADLQKRYGRLLAARNAEVQPVDMGKKGIWHRLVVLPAGPREQAVDFCDRLKGAGYERCYVKAY